MGVDKREIILETKNLTTCYGAIRVLNKLNIKIEQGEIVLLFGPNGAGKSTLLKSIVGLKKPVKGAIIYQQQGIHCWSTEKIIKSGIYLVPEEGGIFKSLTVEENLQLGAFNNYSHYRKSLDEVFILFPILKSRLKQVAGTLSGGEQKMLAFGKALMYKYRLLIFDEPSLGLSPAYIDYFFKVLIKLNQLNFTILLAEQSVNKGLKIAHRAYLLERGEIVLQGKAELVRENSKIKEVYLGNQK